MKVCALFVWGIVLCSCGEEGVAQPAFVDGQILVGNDAVALVGGAVVRSAPIPGLDPVDRLILTSFTPVDCGVGLQLQGALPTTWVEVDFDRDGERSANIFGAEQANGVRTGGFNGQTPVTVTRTAVGDGLGSMVEGSLSFAQGARGSVRFRLIHCGVGAL
jgi:hypothetical protein